jgi:hypothetical protein
VSALNSSGEGPQSSYASATVAGTEPFPGGSDTLTVTGYSGVISVIVTTTTISGSYDGTAIASGMVASGTAASGASASLTWMPGKNKAGSYNVLLTTGEGSRYKNSVSFSNGSATVSYGSMTTIDIEEVKTGSLTISGLPGIGSFAVYVFAPGTDISIYTAVSTAVVAQSYQAVGTIATSGNTFTVVGMSGSEPADFDVSGSRPVLLLNPNGSVIDQGGSTPVYSRASVNFSDGTATVLYGSFTGMFMTF